MWDQTRPTNLQEDDFDLPQNWGPNLVGNDVIAENKELHNKLAMREDADTEAVQEMISAEKYAADTKIAMEQLKSKVELHKKLLHSKAATHAQLKPCIKLTVQVASSAEAATGAAKSNQPKETVSAHATAA